MKFSKLINSFVRRFSDYIALHSNLYLSHKPDFHTKLNKVENWDSLYQSLQDFTYQFTIVGDNLSKGLQDFFEQFNDVIVDNTNLGGAAKSLQKKINLALNVPDDEKNIFYS